MMWAYDGMRLLEITTSDGTIWGVPVIDIATNRAKFYADKEFGGDIERSLIEDTLPLFKSDPYEIVDWAQNNMNASDFSKTYILKEPPKANLENEWCSADMQAIELRDGIWVKIKPA